jgi:hypothetical protein
MTEKTDPMVGVGKIETIPMHERKFHYLNGISTLVRCYIWEMVKPNVVSM